MFPSFCPKKMLSTAGEQVFRQGYAKPLGILTKGLFLINGFAMDTCAPEKSIKKVTINRILKMKGRQEKISAVTAYDATFARIIDETGIDIVLVGDSLGMVVQGHETTLPVTLADVLYHTRCVTRAVKRAFVVADMPFMSYQASIEDGIRNAGLLLQQGAANAVKLEGGREFAELFHRLTLYGIPVMGHIGLTPQSINKFGGYRVQGKEKECRQKLKKDARELEQAGVFSIVLEGIPLDLALEITESLKVPTIGIGAGPHCDGQILVLYDLLGLDPNFNPTFLKKYENLHDRVKTAVNTYVAEVKESTFPTEKYSFQ